MTPDSEKIAKKSGKRGGKEEKSGRKGKNREGFFFFILPLLTGRAGYATEQEANLTNDQPD